MTRADDEVPRPPEDAPDESDAGGRDAVPEEESGSPAGEAADHPGKASEPVNADNETVHADNSESEGADSEDDLPEWEPLTPELVEDEAIRGDFMLQWAVVLLAFLLACTTIAETPTLVHVKTGQYIAEHGWWPPSHDVFSSTATVQSWITDTVRPWINTSWMFDLLSAGIFAVSGATGLTLVKAAVAGLIFGLIVHISRPDVSTWWGSVSAALALLVIYPQFTAMPELVTPLGIALTLWWLCRWRSDSPTASWWQLPVLFAVWGNLDQRMFLGLALLVLYALGEFAGKMFGRPGLANSSRRKQLWGIVAACFVASLVNPFGWHALAAPFTLYGVEYPAFRAHFPHPTIEQVQNFAMLDAVYWETIWKTVRFHCLAGMLLVVVTIVSFVLNRSKVQIGDIFVFAGFLGFALAASHELAVLALLGSAIANLNFQDWYRSNFRQTYAVDSNELLFSRGGRAVTVLALFAVAFLAISGRLSGTDRKRVGLGFDVALQARIDGLREDLADSFDDRPFNFVFGQGDLLIWIEQKPFVDSRVALYSGDGDDDLLDRHSETRAALRRPQTRKQKQDYGMGQPEVWKATFNEFNVTHVIPRMSGTFPDYRTYLDLILSSKDWQLTRLGAVTAVFYRTDVEDSKLKSPKQYQRYLADNQVEFVKQAFSAETAEVPLRAEWARPRSFYQKYLTLPRTVRSRRVQKARHFDKHLNAALIVRELAIPVKLRAAMAYLAIRSANAALADDPQDAEAFRILGNMYFHLVGLESEIIRAAGGRFNNLLRFHQTLNAYSQAARIDPSSRSAALVYSRISEIYLASRKLDLCLEAIDRYEKLIEYSDNPTEAERAQHRANFQIQQQLRPHVDQVTQQVQTALQSGTDLLTVVSICRQQGCSLLALKLLESRVDYVRQSSQARLLQAVLLMEAGRSEDAYKMLELAHEYGRSEWRLPTAMAYLANANYSQAIMLWNEQIDFLQASNMDSLLLSLPLVKTPEHFPLEQMDAAGTALGVLPFQMSEILFNVAVCHLETGDVKNAQEAFHRLLDLNPESSFRPLASFYLLQLADEDIDMQPPSNRIPITPDIFTPETPPAEAKAADAK